MLDAILRGRRARARSPCGNVGLPIVEAVMDPEPYAVYAVELSSFQLHYTSSMSAHAAAVLNVAEDHLDWYVGPDGMADYAADKGRIYDRVQRACVYNVADPVTERLVRDADVVEGARAIGFTLGTPGRRHGRPGRGRARRPGLRRGARALSAAELCTLADLASAGAALRGQRPGRRGARPLGRRAAGGRARRAARPSRPTATGSPRSPTVAEVRYVDDSKATNPHAAAVVAAGLRPGRVGRRRAGQGRHVRRPRRRACATGCGASCCSAGTAR